MILWTKSAYDIPATGSKEIPQVRDMVQAEAKAERPKPELDLVMRVYEPQPSVQDTASFCLAYPFERLRRHLRTAYAQQFIYLPLRFLEQPKQSRVKGKRQKVYPRKDVEHLAAAYLLMPSERHVPGGKTQECNTSRRQGLLDQPDESGLVFLGYVFDDIVNEYQFEYPRRSRNIENIGAGE